MPDHFNGLLKLNSNLDFFSSPITSATTLRFLNLKSKVIVRIYRKNHDLIDEKEISSNGEYPIFNKLRKKGFYLIELVDELTRYEKKIFLNV